MTAQERKVGCRHAARWRSAAAAVVTLLLLVGACGRGEQSVTSATTTPKDATTDKDHEVTAEVSPCGLVSEAEAEAALGPIVAPHESDLAGWRLVPGQRVCLFLLESDAQAGAVLGVTSADASSKFDGILNDVSQAASEASGTGVEEITGLGDRAVWVESFRLLVVLRQDTLFSVQVMALGEDKSLAKPKALQIGKSVARRLADR